MRDEERENLEPLDVICLADIVPRYRGDRSLPARWLPWRLNPFTYVLYVTEPYYYEIDLERCLTSAKVLDWIFQIAGKTWATETVVAGLIHAFEDVLHPQSHLCSGGRPKILTVSQIKMFCKSYAR